MNEATRADLIALQQTYVRLLYSDEARREYDDDPALFAANRGLSARVLQLLPQTDSEGFRAELFGRRLQAVQEVRPSYSATLGVLMGSPTGDREVISADWFSAFLGSKHFLDPRFSLPHPSGVGRGHEGLTRFFFWVRDRFTLREPGANIPLRTELYADFARVLEALTFEAVGKPYSDLRAGTFWLRIAGEPEFAFALTPDRRFITVRGSDVSASLKAVGMTDLDALEP